MAKKKGHRDAEKKAALAAKKEAKQEKAAKKRLIKLNGGVVDDDDDSSNDSNESDVDTDDNDDEAFHRLLKKYTQQQLDNDNPTSVGAAAATTSSTRSVSSKVILLPNELPFPCARANATFTITDDSKKKEIYLFGGEYFDGTNIIVSDQLFKYELPSSASTTTNGKVAVGQWKQIITPTSPPPRCAHAAGYYNKALYIFGGESSGGTTVSTASSKKASSSKGSGEYYHYRDIWKYDIVQQQWYEMKPSIPLATGKTSIPTPRSGMSMTIWKHYMILFGGFFEAATQAPPRFYNDVFVLNLQTEQWLDVPYSKLSIRPEPRSACNNALIQSTNHNGDVWVIHGGFSKLQTNASRLLQNSQTAANGAGDIDDGLPTAETIVYTDAWVLHLNPILEGKPPVWERLISSLSKNKRYETAQIIHNGRSGVASTSYQNNLLLFGGVIDQELLHHKVDSTFYNDLSLFHVEKRKFIPIHVEDPSAKLNSKKNAIDGQANSDQDMELNTVNNSLQAIDINLSLDDEAVISENRKDMGWDIDKLRTNMFAFVDGNGNTIYEKIDSIMQKQKTEEIESTKNRIAERTEPLPRIKACIVMSAHTMYVYGGILEIGDREVTLDDMWCIDLRKSRTWQCIYPGTMHEQVWRGAVYDDDDSYYSNNTNNKDDEIDVEEKEDAAGVISTMKPDAVDDKMITLKDASPIASVNPKQEMVELVERYNMNDDNQTPRPDETLSDFFSRTEKYWKEQTSLTIRAKIDQDANHNECFVAAEMRYNELVPVMQRLTELKILRKQEKSKQKSKS